MENFYESTMEVAKGIEQIFLSSNRRVRELIEEGKELIWKGTEKNE